MKKVGIIGAMPEEVSELLTLIENPTTETHGERKYTSGTINNTNIVLVFSRWGKVAAASTVTTLIQVFKVDFVLFFGIAGAINSSLNVGDVVLGDKIFQHDLDARPLMKQFEIPLLNMTFIQCETQILEKAYLALKGMDIYKKSASIYADKYNLGKSKILKGNIATGDQFISKNEQSQKIKAELPNILCVEMEGGAVAQVCYENKVPFLIIRTISDKADHNAPTDFQEFLVHVASPLAKTLAPKLLELLK